MALLKTLRMWYPLVKNPGETPVFAFHFSKTHVCFDSLSFPKWNLGQVAVACFLGFLGHDSVPVNLSAEELNVKIEKVDLWADRMDLVPDEDDGFDGFDGYGVADLCSLQNLCREGLVDVD